MEYVTFILQDHMTLEASVLPAFPLYIPLKKKSN